MHVVARLLIPLEALVCFGPLLFILLLGIFFSPGWIIGIDQELEALGGAASLTFNDLPHIWQWLYPLVLIILGLAGAVGIISAVFLIVSNRPRRTGALVAKYLSFAGLMAVALFNYPWVSTVLDGDVTLDAVWPLLFYFALPLTAALHIILLLSHQSKPDAG
jgi:hypothetical protein